MNCRREIAKMAVPPGNPARPRDWVRGVLDSTSQGEPVLSLSKEHPRTPGRTAISVVVVTPGRDEISGLEQAMKFHNRVYWQDMFSPYLEIFIPAFCAEALEAKSVY